VAKLGQPKAKNHMKSTAMQRKPSKDRQTAKGEKEAEPTGFISAQLPQ
jgi:hypothetical protein